MPATAEQLAVRNNIDGYNLVTAPPGSGKTFTIIQCVLGLLSSPDSRIIAVTFTNAAAEEMKSRVGKEIKGSNRKQIFIATFHSILISQARQAGFGSHLRLLVGSELHPYMQQVMGRFNDKKLNEAKVKGGKEPRKLKWVEACEIITKRGCQLSNMITDVEFIYWQLPSLLVQGTH
ncbi:UvrD-helicase domain-containing protein [Shewanella yunxiaonensis]|uniref:UvrD-helicase domain-containing protein n=1 Tax=Shewanella yunxiaonensis TaxID=2829809 RepID=A0ABX7YU27_9GAMM|nr:UvrD-helicase domain-containing protein [Shewanella yunxiaonensis]QUN05851.1 UvrD-helicase domain-containing protein [Shewanella yunxiaonensis]